MQTFTHIIDAWPSLTAFATDLGEQYGTAKQWRRRDSIPAHAWKGVVEKAHERGIPGITLDLLAQLAARKVGGDGRRAA